MKEFAVKQIDREKERGSNQTYFERFVFIRRLFSLEEELVGSMCARIDEGFGPSRLVLMRELH